MLHISSKPSKRAKLVLFPKENLRAIPFLDTDEKKTIQTKLDDGLKIIILNKALQTYILCAINVIDDKDKMLEQMRITGFNIHKMCKEAKEAEISLEMSGDIGKENLSALLLGIELSNYEFNKYKNKSKISILSIFIDPLFVDTELIDEINIIRESVCYTKDLVNEPVSYLTAVQ